MHEWLAGWLSILLLLDVREEENKHHTTQPAEV